MALLDVFHFEATTEQIEAAILAKGVRGKDFSASAAARSRSPPAVANGSRPPASAATAATATARTGAERGGDGEVLEGKGAQRDGEEEGKQEAGKGGRGGG